MPRYDNHVRARASIARKVAQRRFDEGLNPVGRADVRWAMGEGRFPSIEDLMPAAYEALAAYEWPAGWGVKYSRFRIFGKPMFVDGETRNVPARIIHRIMVGMPDLPQFTAGVRKRASAKPTVAEDEEDEFDFDEAVVEARAHLEAMKFAETDADDGLLATPAGDSTIDRRRRESLDAGYRVEEAELALEKALREQKLFGRQTDAA